MTRNEANPNDIRCDGDRAILFAGGGTGGHIFPSLAIAERLDERPGVRSIFACSDRPLDAEILSKAGRAFFPLGVRPLPRRPWRLPGFARALSAAKRRVAAIIRDQNVGVVVAMGGFVCAPAVLAARRLGVPTMLVNLDAHPGIANRLLARRCERLYAVHDGVRIAGRATTRVPLPIRRDAVGPDDRAEARARLGLHPDRPVLLITGASQGADSINRFMVELVKKPEARAALDGWQVLHLAGHDRAGEVRDAYEGAKLEATVLEFCDRMGCAWRAADVAISRGGANSVAEAVANRTPTLFLPYPYHRDLHQRLNVRPLADLGAAVLCDDRIEPEANLRELGPVLIDLVGNEKRRRSIAEALGRLPSSDGAAVLAAAALDLAGHRAPDRVV